MTRNRFHRGPWADSAHAAMDDALEQVGVILGDYVECQYSTGDYRLEPVDPSFGRKAIDVEIHWSEARQQYKAHLREVAAAPLDPATREE